MILGNYYYIDEKEKTVEFIDLGLIENNYFKFSLGELLVEFLNTDFSNYEKYRKNFSDFLESPDIFYSPTELLDSDILNEKFCKQLKSPSDDFHPGFRIFDFIVRHMKELNFSYNYLSMYYINYMFDFSAKTLINEKFNFVFQ